MYLHLRYNRWRSTVRLIFIESTLGTHSYPIWRNFQTKTCRYIFDMRKKQPTSRGWFTVTLNERPIQSSSSTRLLVGRRSAIDLDYSAPRISRNSNRSDERVRHSQLLGQFYLHMDDDLSAVVFSSILRRLFRTAQSNDPSCDQMRLFYGSGSQLEIYHRIERSPLPDYFRELLLRLIKRILRNINRGNVTIQSGTIFDML